MKENQIFQGWTLSILSRNVPEHVLLINPIFDYDENAILAEADKEGYHIVRQYPAPFLSSFSGDKACIIFQNSIQFLCRQYFKGKPGKEFRLSRDGDKPAYFSAHEISYWKNGEYHRDHNRPAMLSQNEICWNVNGKWHRDDMGETIISAFFGRKWHKNHDLLRRETMIDGKIVIQRFVGYENGYGKWENE